MRITRLMLFAALGAFILFAAPRADAGPNLSLTNDVKAALMAAKPVRGLSVERAIFDGKPVLVTFFASW